MKLGPVQGGGENGWYVPPGEDASSTQYVIACKNPAGTGPKTGDAPQKEYVN